MSDQGNAQDFIRNSQYHLCLIAGGFALVGGLIGAWHKHYFLAKGGLTKDLKLSNGDPLSNDWGAPLSLNPSATGFTTSDRCYRVNSVRKEEALGWESNG